MIITKYKNGNYSVILLDDGTKIRYTTDNEYHPEFPESIDIKLTNRCPYTCNFCHEDSKPDEKIMTMQEIHNKLRKLQIPEDTELAFGGGALSTLPDIGTIMFEQSFKNITINQKELNNEAFFNTIWRISSNNIVSGIGVSFNDIKDKKSIERLKELIEIDPAKVVIHTIYGITTKEQYDFLYNDLHAQKVLVLGYKNFRRGKIYKDEHSNSILKNQKSFDENLNNYRDMFPTLSFDCLAVEQLDLKSKINKEDWNKYYMGDDGQFTMYLDLTKDEFAKNSASPRRYKIQPGQTIRDLFKIIREEK